MTPRDERRAGLRSDPLGWSIAVLAALVAWGCSDHRGPVLPAGGPGSPAPRRAVAAGVLAPVWCRGADLDTALAEIRAANVPAGATVVILDPGAFYSPASPTGLAMGECYHELRTIYVAWRATQDGPRLPALEHEVRHLTTGQRGHP